MKTVVIGNGKIVDINADIFYGNICHWVMKTKISEIKIITIQDCITNTVTKQMLINDNPPTRYYATPEEAHGIKIANNKIVLENSCVYVWRKTPKNPTLVTRIVCGTNVKGKIQLSKNENKSSQFTEDNLKCYATEKEALEAKPLT